MVCWCVLCTICVSFLALVCDSIETHYIMVIMSSIWVFTCVLGFGVLIYCFFVCFFSGVFPFFLLMCIAFIGFQFVVRVLGTNKCLDW